jgi:hypothetical protein
MRRLKTLSRNPRDQRVMSWDINRLISLDPRNGTSDMGGYYLGVWVTTWDAHNTDSFTEAHSSA